MWLWRFLIVVVIVHIRVDNVLVEPLAGTEIETAAPAMLQIPAHRSDFHAFAGEVVVVSFEQYGSLSLRLGLVAGVYSQI